MISGAQVRAARAMLGWTTRELARRAVVSIATVNLIEGAEGLPSTTRANVEAVQATLEAAGIEFLGGDAPGMRLRRKKLSRWRKIVIATKAGNTSSAGDRADTRDFV